MNEGEINKLVEVLQHVKKRPGMYFADGIEPVDNFISGFMLGVQLTSEASDAVTQPDIIWEEFELKPNISIYQQLRDRGLDKHEAIEQYISILISHFQSLKT